MNRRDQLAPTTALRSTLVCATGPLAALDADPARDGRTARGTVLLLPGYTGSKEDFVPILDPLRDNDFRAVAIDLPGQYESAGPDHEDAYTPAALGRVCASVVQALAADGPVVLLGHSYGGLVARGTVLAGAQLAGVALLCSGPAAFRFGQRFDALRAGEPIIREYGKTAVYDSTVAIGRAARKFVPPDLADLLRRRFIDSNQAGLLGMGAALLAEPDRVDELRAALRASGTAVAVIAGADDDAWPLPDQQDMARRLGTDLVVIDGAAHSPALENPDGLLTVLLPLLTAWVSRRH